MQMHGDCEDRWREGLMGYKGKKRKEYQERKEIGLTRSRWADLPCFNRLAAGHSQLVSVRIPSGRHFEVAAVSVV